MGSFSLELRTGRASGIAILGVFFEARRSAAPEGPMTTGAASGLARAADG